MTVKSQNIKKRNAMNKTFLTTTKNRDTNDLMQDSIDQQNQLTTRE